MSLYVNPTPGTTPPTPTLTSTAYNLKAGIKSISLKSNELGAGWTYDELRLGDSYADVAPMPIPEPGAAALVFGALGTRLLVRRRPRGC